MAAITTRETAGTGATVAGVPLTNAQIDQNFINLNTELGQKLDLTISRTAATFLAAPATADGTPGFRAIVATDIPTLNQSTTGNAATVTNGVYTTGDQTIGGTKTFSSTISGSINGNAATVTNGVYTTGDQTIGGTKTFSSTISGSINGNAATVTNGVYTTGSYADPAWITSLAKSKVGLGSVENTALSTWAGSTNITTIGAATATSLSVTNTITSNGSFRERQIAIAASDINLSLGNFFTRTISGATSLTVSNVPTTSTAISFVLDLTNAGSATITWWGGIKWANGVAPSLTAAGRDVLGFYTHDAGTTWVGLLLGKDVK